MDRPDETTNTPKPRARKGLLMVAMLAVVAAGIAGGVRFFDATATAKVAETDSVRALPVDTIAIRHLASYEMVESYVGRVSARREADLGFERSGLLVQVLVSEGDRVEKDQNLARLNTSKLEARLGELKAKSARARASRREVAVRLELAEQNRNRREALLKRKAISREAYDEALADRNVQKAKLAAAEAAIREQEAAIRSVAAELELSVLRAPFAGTIVSRAADEGKALSIGETVVQILETGALEARVGVPLMTAKKLELGRTYEIEALKRHYAATLSALPPRIDADTRTMTAIFDLDADADLNSGQLVRLSLNRRVDENGFWLPTAALVEGRRGLWSVYVLSDADDEGVARVTRRDVQVLHGQAEKAYVRGTLLDGETVAASGVHRLVPGVAVIAR